MLQTTVSEEMKQDASVDDGNRVSNNISAEHAALVGEISRSEPDIFRARYRAWAIMLREAFEDAT